MDVGVGMGACRL